MARKATHTGHCQACGRLQKLPNGFLSQHGYTVTHGFFSGTCVGSGHQPYEESFALISQFIDNAKGAMAGVEATQLRLREPADVAVATVHHYQISNRRCGYVWLKVAIEMQQEDGYRTFWYSAPGRNEQIVRHKVAEYQSASNKVSALQVATVLNSKYANWLQHEVDSLTRYIKWQQNRIDTWKPTPLLPLGAKDKEGFVPTQKPY